ncbi:hypothetical protein E2C01_009933 [Portunus trituberculatus]|uniref:Uncharacterized protein n=1 Tax=Portunus trituberculatus TaxID=210409 RepID=A0A5B7D717_PORTR|nr:hypothetical protein [Portunus trituberculatus]
MRRLPSERHHSDREVWVLVERVIGETVVQGSELLWFSSHATRQSQGADRKQVRELFHDLIPEGHSLCPAPDIIQSVHLWSNCCVTAVTPNLLLVRPPVVSGLDVVVAGSNRVVETRIVPFSMSVAALQCYHRHSST